MYLNDDSTTSGHRDEVRTAERAEIARLKRRLERERASRREAESIGERATADLYASLRELRELHDQQDEAIRRLRDLDHAKDAFLSTVSHELRTPLTSIIAVLEMIEDGDIVGPSGMSDAVEVMGRNAHRLRYLVEDLLTFSELEHPREAMVVERVDLVALIEQTHRSLGPVASDRGLVLTCETGEGVPVIDGNHALLGRVVQSLLDNALKFTPTGGRVGTHLTRDDGDVVLEVTDTGIGIAADEVDQLFARFFRSSRSVAEETRGTGLGLALVRAAVDRHHGEVGLRSVEGEGTTVTVRLPVELPHA